MGDPIRPIYEHHCAECTFLGTVTHPKTAHRSDLYACSGRGEKRSRPPTTVALLVRNSSTGHDHDSSCLAHVTLMSGFALVACAALWCEFLKVDGSSGNRTKYSVDGEWLK